jgi:hypothetical protein
MIEVPKVTVRIAVRADIDPIANSAVLSRLSATIDSDTFIPTEGASMTGPSDFDDQPRRRGVCTLVFLTPNSVAPQSRPAFRHPDPMMITRPELRTADKFALHPAAAMTGPRTADRQARRTCA